MPRLPVRCSVGLCWGPRAGTLSSLGIWGMRNRASGGFAALQGLLGRKRRSCGVEAGGRSVRPLSWRGPVGKDSDATSPGGLLGWGWGDLEGQRASSLPGSEKSLARKGSEKAAHCTPKPELLRCTPSRADTRNRASLCLKAAVASDS